MSTQATIISISLIAFFMVLSAFFSSSETAFMSLQRVRILHLANIGRAGAKKMLKRMDQPERTLSTVLLGNNMVNIAAAAVGTALAVAWLGENLGIVVATLGIAFLLLVFSEVIPKTFATRHPEWLAFHYLRLFALVEVLLLPVSVFLELIGRGIISLSGGRIGARNLVSAEVLRSVISVGREHGAVDREEAKMLQNVLVFRDRLVKEVMTPRTEMVWLDEDTTLNTFLDEYDTAPLSRFPVYKEAYDNVVGILHTRDVIRALHGGQVQSDSLLIELVRPIQFVPETKRLGDLFFEMRSSGQQMYLVVDEYGGVSGLVTNQQLVAAIMGRVADDEAVRDEVEELESGAFQVDGGMPIQEASETLGFNIPDGDYETIAGFALDILAHIPTEGEAFRFQGRRITISEMKGVKIERLLVTKR